MEEKKPRESLSVVGARRRSKRIRTRERSSFREALIYSNGLFGAGRTCQSRWKAVHPLLASIETVRAGNIA